MNYPNAQQQQWYNAYLQAQQAYFQQQNSQLASLAYQQAPSSPVSYGYGQMPNALQGQAGPPNNAATALFRPTNPFNFQLMNYIMNAPGGQTIGLPGDGTQSASPELLASILGRSGVG